MLSAFLGWGLVVAVGLPFWLSFVLVLGIYAALCFLLEASVVASRCVNLFTEPLGV